MGRPTGSRNKRSRRRKVAVADVKVVDSVDKVGDNSVVSAPRGTIKETCECSHHKALHYGGPHASRGGWCNAGGCKCQLIQL